VQTQTDEYTRYELLSPESANFAICYEVTATAVGGGVLLQSHSLDFWNGQPGPVDVLIKAKRRMQ